MKWNACVDMAVTANYENIEADTMKEAEQIAEDIARAVIEDYNSDVECSSASAFAWESEG